jgi:ankyrin repeat protein
MSGFIRFFSFRSPEQKQLNKILKELGKIQPKKTTVLGSPVNVDVEAYNFSQICTLIETKNKHGKNKVNPNIKNKHGHTILDLAVAFGNPDEVAHLLGIADFNSESLMSALHSAAGCDDKDCIELIARKVSVNAADDEGTTALMIAANYGHTECIKTLIRLGADIEAKDHEGINALVYTIMGNKLECMNLLIEEYQVTIEATTNNSFSALIMAAQFGRLNCLKSLLDHGAQIDAATNKDGNTALIVAASYGNNKIVRELIARGANVNQTNRYGKTAAYVAMAYKRKKCYQILKTEMEAKQKIATTPTIAALLASPNLKDAKEIVAAIKIFCDNAEQELSDNDKITCLVTFDDLNNSSNVELHLTKIPKRKAEDDPAPTTYGYTLQAFTPGIMYKYAIDSDRKIYIHGTLADSMIIAATKGELKDLIDQCKQLCETNRPRQSM